MLWSECPNGNKYPILIIQHNFIMLLMEKVSKVAYTKGMVVSTCRHCRKLHLIADNEGKLDMAQYGKKIEDFLRDKGESVQKISVTEQDLEENYLVDKDGVVTLVPKIAGQVLLFFPPFTIIAVEILIYFSQPAEDVNIVDFQPLNPPSRTS